ncbi:uncharacterized protein K444DRAFT_619023 [Hyaloscypha bicolor E]|uniref:F-box domain-containing protein n=1 Tax=Hyaloscypha bicolor E TaxID=1095630 RepID=A0A2J6SRW4_9HELO|nr:uncharacterized protein K444DRAFT_619023 [Hyaloscypha bicolor E]PMD53479.1 hypothetical protein K444DRAFT_619023 [Hyaloscypha bicolor E]
MASQASLSSLSVDLLFKIFKLLERPSKLCLALSSLGFCISSQSTTTSIATALKLSLPNEETEDGKAEAIVQGILDEWLRRKCGVEGGVVFCASATNSCVYVQRMEEGLGAPRC